MVWSDSTLAAKPNKAEGVRKAPKSTFIPDYLKTVKLHQVLAKMTHGGGQLHDMLKWVEDILATKGQQSCLFVGVWSFKDFFKGNNNVIYPLPGDFFVDLNRFIVCLNTLFPKSVMICGGTSRTWDVRDTAFDIHSARVRERLRQGGILVVNPTTGLFDTLPKRDGDPWHFHCFSHGDRVWNQRLIDPTLLSLENLISHVVLIAHHLVEPNAAISSRDGKSWISDMSSKSASAHLTLAIQCDPREDVLPRSYSRRANDSGNGTIDLQSLGSFGIDPARLRGRVLKARTQPAAECHIVSEVADNASIDRLYNMVFGGRELFMDIAEEGEIEQSERRSGSPSPVRCPDEVLLRGQLLADGLWSDVAIEIVWASSRHAGTKESIAPYHWMILQSARLDMVPSNGSLFDFSPGESSEYFDNHFFRCCKCEKRWWLVDTPVLGICPACLRSCGHHTWARREENP